MQQLSELANLDIVDRQVETDLAMRKENSLNTFS